MRYVKPPESVALPPGVVTDTLFAPAELAGVTAVMLVALVTEKDVAATPPIVTAFVPVRFVPAIVIVVPPAIGPADGVTDVIVGAETKVNALARLPVPPGVVTETLFAPALPAGVTAVIVVPFTTTTPVADVLPNFTDVAPVRFVPVIVTAVPHVVGPWFGVTDASAGGA
jgi:hypothetical protein